MRPSGCSTAPRARRSRRHTGSWRSGASLFRVLVAATRVGQWSGAVRCFPRAGSRGTLPRPPQRWSTRRASGHGRRRRRTPSRSWSCAGSTANKPCIHEAQTTPAPMRRKKETSGGRVRGETSFTKARASTPSHAPPPLCQTARPPPLLYHCWGSCGAVY